MNFLLIVYCHLLPAILPTQCVRDIRLDFLIFIFLFFFPTFSAEQGITKPSVSGTSCEHFFFPLIFFFFFLSYFFSICWDTIPLIYWLLYWGELAHWCKRTDRQVGLRRGREDTWGHSTNQLHRGSFLKLSLMFAFLHNIAIKSL